jgi:hypothetical protein
MKSDSNQAHSMRDGKISVFFDSFCFHHTIMGGKEDRLLSADLIQQFHWREGMMGGIHFRRSP